jgi:hypothetical protein
MFQLSAKIDGVRTLKNKCLKIGLETQDITSFTPEELGHLFLLEEKQIWVAFKETPVKQDDLDIKEVKMNDGRTPGQRLRSVLYVFWEKNKPTDNFETFYASQMERIINWIKDKLD